MKSRAGVDRALNTLADPTRRAVMDLLAAQPRRAGELAAMLKISAPALSRHLRMLRANGFVINDEVRDDARIRLYRLRPGAMASLRDWIGEVESFWGGQLASFKAFAEAPVTVAAPRVTATVARRRK
jgi:DNA-binding transcriptional ArsR family regulator